MQASPFALGYPDILHRPHLELPDYAILRDRESPINLLKHETEDSNDSECASENLHKIDSDSRKRQPIEPQKLDENYVNNLDQLLKNQLLKQINFKTMISSTNNSNNIGHEKTNKNINNDDKITNLINCDNENKINFKSTNFTIENLIRK